MQWVKESGVTTAAEWAAATAQIQSLAQELPFASGTRPLKKKNTESSNIQRERIHKSIYVHIHIYIKPNHYAIYLKYLNKLY